MIEVNNVSLILNKYTILDVFPLKPVREKQ